MRSPELSIVIPVFNEAGNLEPLTGELGVVLDRLGQPSEIVYVDDGSTDESLDELLRLARSVQRIRILRMSRNSGQSAALAAGFRAAKGTLVVTLDADLQNDPADIPRLLQALQDCDVVSGIRVERQDSWVRRVSSRIANRARNAMLSDGVTDVGCSLKVYRAELLTGLPAFNGLHRFLPALLKMRGARITEMRVSHRPRIHGESKYTINNRLWRGLLDLVGVRWLQSRWIEPGAAEEIEVWTPKSSGTSSDSPVRPSSSRASSSSGSPRSATRRA